MEQPNFRRSWERHWRPMEHGTRPQGKDTHSGTRTRKPAGGYLQAAEKQGDPGTVSLARAIYMSKVRKTRNEHWSGVVQKAARPADLWKVMRWRTHQTAAAGLTSLTPLAGGTPSRTTAQSAAIIHEELVAPRYGRSMRRHFPWKAQTR